MKSMNSLALLFAFGAVIILLTISCKAPLESITTNIRLEETSGKVNLSDVLQLEGFTQIQAGPSDGVDRFRKISKALFLNRRIVVVDNEGDFQNVRIFDMNTGAEISKIDRTEEKPAFSDIALDDQGGLCFLAAGKRAFEHYDLTGHLRASLPNGVIGDKIVCLPDSKYLVYNEYSATDISGYYQLLFFDKEGNLLKRLYPYSANLDNIGYSFSGFVSQSGGSTWFSPPFCDTVYEITGMQLAPRYTFDFGNDAVPREIRQKRISGMEIYDNAHLAESFIKIDNFVLFDYYRKHKMNIGLFDERANVLYSFSNAEKDYFYPLLKYGQIFSKDDHTFAFLLTAPQLNYMLENKSLDMEGIKRNHPDLFQVLNGISPQTNRNPLLLYFSVKAEKNTR